MIDSSSQIADDNKRVVYSLFCDNCGDVCKEHFDSFEDAVAYIKVNGWRSCKNRSGWWMNACPSCNTPDVMRKLKDRETIIKLKGGGKDD